MNVLQEQNQKLVAKIVYFLRKEFKKRNKTKAILGFSGGLDSTTVAFLCKKAGLDLYSAILPYKKRDLSEIEGLAKSLNLPKNHIIISDIAPAVDYQVSELKKMTKVDKVDKGNIMARQRMIILYTLARSLNGLVVGTSNLSEYLLGYFTLHGDATWDINPIFGLFKTQVFELAKFLGVPKEIINKKPTADLWQGQTDEGELGFSYQEADAMLFLSFIKKYPKEKIIKKFGFSRYLVKKVLNRVRETKYKRQEPPKFNF